jgi:hypothetical protein
VRVRNCGWVTLRLYRTRVPTPVAPHSSSFAHRRVTERPCDRSVPSKQATGK